MPSSPKPNTDRLAVLEARISAAERRLRLTWVVALFGMILAFVLGGHKEAVAGKTKAASDRLASRLAALERKTAPLSLVSDPNTKQPTVRFSGVNVQIVSGSGHTDGAINGRGNLIVGYNEQSLSTIGAYTIPATRTGSHNLVVGCCNGYGSFGGFVAGAANGVTGAFASVSGGFNNLAIGKYSNVSGGVNNRASGSISHISGGQINRADGQCSSVTGGGNNTASGQCSSVTGGSMNTASGIFSSILGGEGNKASGETCSVSGGGLNRADGHGSSISGGAEQSVDGQFGWLAESGGLSP